MATTVAISKAKVLDCDNLHAHKTMDDNRFDNALFMENVLLFLV
jgi:hypothetical protein